MKKIILFVWFLSLFLYQYPATYSAWYDTGNIAYTSSSPVGDCGSSICETTPNVSTVCPGDNIHDAGISGDTTSAVKISGLPVDGGTTVTSYQEGLPASGTMDCFSWDSKIPEIGDIGTISPNDGTDLLATNSQNITFDIDSTTHGGAPITLIEGYFEDQSTADSFGVELSSVSSTMNQNLDIQNVDNARDFDGSRTYSYKITKICDQAQNCIEDINGLRVLNYQVYAASDNIGIRNVVENQLNDTSNIADATEKNLTVSLFDIYGNQIVPASGIDRTIDFNFDVTNTLKLDQYRRTGDGVYLSTPKNSSYLNRLTNNNSFDSETSSNGLYTFKFKILTPTYNSSSSDGRELADGNFFINNINFDINQNIFSDILARSIDNSNFETYAKPIYKTEFDGQWITDGFIEGATQTGTLNLSSNTASCAGCGARTIYLEFGSGSQVSISKLNLKTLNPDGFVGEGNGNYSSFVSGFPSNYSYNLETVLLLQTGAVLNDLQSSYLSSHIGYTLDGQNIVYNSDILNKDNYWGTINGGNMVQSGLKIYGRSQSQNQVDIIENQKEEDIHIIGKNDKALLKSILRKEVYQMIKGITPESSGTISRLDGENWDDNISGTKLKDSTVLYYGDLDGDNIILGNTPDEQVEGIKTIVIEGGNLYIKENMEYVDNESILGIVVLKDENGEGGNIYIDPSVTKVVGTLFADKSVIGYSDTLGGELDGNTTQYTLRNQLYIYGSLFTENTVGGSRMDPPVCPYYVTELCELEVAQKYDLNYLRRYFINLSGVPASGGLQVFNTAPKNKYPVIIEYNSNIQGTPPPFFEQ